MISHQYRNNVSGLIHVGENAGWKRPSQLGHHIVVFRNSVGYDGEAYYIVADDPFLRRPWFRDAFRYQRIGYPLVVWAVSLGQRPWRPLAMLGVNLVAVLVLAYLSALLVFMTTTRTRIWWTLACVINPSIIIAVHLDLAEPFALTLSLAGLIFYLRQRIACAALLFSAALLTREVAILFVLPLLLAEINARRFRYALMLAASIIPFLLWQIILWRICGQFGVTASKGNFDIPLKGILAVVAAAHHASFRDAIAHQGSILVIAIFVGVASIVAVVQARRQYDPIIGIMIAHAVAALFAGPAIWIGFEGAARVFGGLYPLTILAFARRGSLTLGALAVGVCALTLLTIMGIAFSPIRPYYVTP